MEPFAGGKGCPAGRSFPLDFGGCIYYEYYSSYLEEVG